VDLYALNIDRPVGRNIEAVGAVLVGGKNLHVVPARRYSHRHVYARLRRSAIARSQASDNVKNLHLGALLKRHSLMPGDGVPGLHYLADVDLRKTQVVSIADFEHASGAIYFFAEYPVAVAKRRPFTANVACAEKGNAGHADEARQVHRARVIPDKADAPRKRCRGP